MSWPCPPSPFLPSHYPLAPGRISAQKNGLFNARFFVISQLAAKLRGYLRLLSGLDKRTSYNDGNVFLAITTLAHAFVAFRTTPPRASNRVMGIRAPGCAPLSKRAKRRHRPGRPPCLLSPHLPSPSLPSLTSHGPRLHADPWLTKPPVKICGHAPLALAFQARERAWGGGGGGPENSPPFFSPAAPPPPPRGGAWGGGGGGLQRLPCLLCPCLPSPRLHGICLPSPKLLGSGSRAWLCL